MRVVSFSSAFIGKKMNVYFLLYTKRAEESLHSPIYIVLSFSPSFLYIETLFCYSADKLLRNFFYFFLEHTVPDLIYLGSPLIQTLIYKYIYYTFVLLLLSMPV